jgi:hypothetical protein
MIGETLAYRIHRLLYCYRYQISESGIDVEEKIVWIKGRSDKTVQGPRYVHGKISTHERQLHTQDYCPPTHTIKRVTYVIIDVR